MNSATTCDDASCASSSLKKMNGTIDIFSCSNYNLILNDGTIMTYFQLDSTNSTHSGYVYSTGGECGWFFVDVNGKWGKDIYGIWIMNNKILPWGAKLGRNN